MASGSFSSCWLVVEIWSSTSITSCWSGCVGLVIGVLVSVWLSSSILCFLFSVVWVGDMLCLVLVLKFISLTDSVFDSSSSSMFDSSLSLSSEVSLLSDLSVLSSVWFSSLDFF